MFVSPEIFTRLGKSNRLDWSASPSLKPQGFRNWIPKNMSSNSLREETETQRTMTDNDRHNQENLALFGFNQLFINHRIGTMRWPWFFGDVKQPSSNLSPKSMTASGPSKRCDSRCTTDSLGAWDHRTPKLQNSLPMGVAWIPFPNYVRFPLYSCWTADKKKGTSLNWPLELAWTISSD